ncbi:MAG: cryptochrome/photolyase family protein [Pseudanabaenaceae cyanobacterium]
MTLTVIWHRRDLRIDDHPALAWAEQRGGRTIGIFIFDPGILHLPPAQLTTGGGQVAFMLGCLQELREQYRRLGSELYFFLGDPVEKLQHLAIVLKPDYLLFCEDIEPFALARDRQARTVLTQLGVTVHSFTDIGLHDPASIQTNSGEPYKVFTPFWRTWRKLAKPAPHPRPCHLVGIEPPGTLAHISFPTIAQLGFTCEQSIPEAGEQAGLELLREFQERGLLRYQSTRDYPAIGGTSRLSPHLRFGTVGIRRIWQATQELEPLIRSEEERLSLETWRQELAWREFYQHVLYFFPSLANTAYRPAMQKFHWCDRTDYFQAWCMGRTGYPIVDAAMRQLNQTGWMHNRCRMIVASFLTKDLMINWQWGEQYFMQKLVDGDQSANNGGWQWSASSGMDPKPLRIFNPATQAQKFDPDGDYIRHWLPELYHVPTIQLLSGQIEPSYRHKADYPPPLVDHKQQQELFKKEYARCKGNVSAD